jgi:hypothetical protein
VVRVEKEIGTQCSACHIFSDFLCFSGTMRKSFDGRFRFQTEDL